MEQEHAAPAHDAVTTGFDFATMVNDPAFWALVGLIIFFGIVIYMKVPRTLTKSLDARATKISNELFAAEDLRKEAEAKLAEAKQRQAVAEAEAVEIIAAARREADQLAEAAAVALTERIARREKIAEERIARAEAEAMRDVRLAAVDTASRAAAAILTEQLTGKAADDEFARSLDSVKKALS